MPNLDIPYEVALTRHPEVVNACIDQVRAGKSKDKNTDPATWRWTYSWGTRVEATTLERLLRDGPKEWSKMNVDQRVKDQVMRSLPVWLMGTPPNKRTCGRADLEPTYMPDEVQEWIRKGVTEQFDEEQRVAGLSEEQRQEELEAMLRELRKGKGFVELVVKR